MFHIPEKSIRYKTALRDYERTLSVADAFLSAADTKALSNQGITVVTPYTESNRAMQLEAFGKRIDIRMSFVFSEAPEFLAEVKAVYVPDDESKEEKVLEKIWIDKMGAKETITSHSKSVYDEFYPALGFLVKAVDTLLDSHACDASLDPNKGVQVFL
ncbi:hypothetical protein BZG72_15435 [Salinivibrio sp. PR6]|uniref:hypothetical protein n=1 Tax=Salinivibrio sp. PR6 TaxID=1909485 RepID=UPI000988B205|nr:hypothetical protein [Salinivibrio sp. PR6]OOE78406.1 hypothetical protein BZG72_15435 [Salinivibrio sp. PR6]